MVLPCFYDKGILADTPQILLPGIIKSPIERYCSIGEYRLTALRSSRGKANEKESIRHKNYQLALDACKSPTHWTSRIGSPNLLPTHRCPSIGDQLTLRPKMRRR